MYASASSHGLCLQGSIADISIPLLLGALDHASVTGTLNIQSPSHPPCCIFWERGYIVDFQWNQTALATEGTKDRAIVSLVVKQSTTLFDITEGNYEFKSAPLAAPRLLTPGRLPIAFFIRYGLASTNNKQLTNQLFEAAFQGSIQLKLRDPDTILNALGNKAFDQLQPHADGAPVEASEANDALRQLLSALWAADLLELTPQTHADQMWQQLLSYFKQPVSSLALPTTFSTPFVSIEAPPTQQITERETASDSYISLLPVQDEAEPEDNYPELEIPLSLQEDATTSDAIYNLLSQMEDWGASDLFVTQGKAPAVRVHGRIHILDLPPTDLLQIDAFLSAALSDKKRKQFQESGDLDFGYSLEPGHRFRFNLYRQQGQLALVVRAIPSGAVSIEDLGLPDALRIFASQPRGLILVTGATGSGKSTTLAAMVHYINQTKRTHIVTVEEPIEFVHRDIKSRISQREIGADTASFHSALRHVVRESPDVILIGEMRDMETMSVALSAALTGHLVLASLHTIDAVQTLQRIMSYYPEHLRHQVAMDLSLCLQGVISQRLLPTKKADRRVAAIEILACTPAVAQLLRQQRIDELSDHLKHSSDPHTQNFNRSLLELYRKGEISYEIGRAYATNPEEFALSAQGMETGISTFRRDDEQGPITGLDIKSLLQMVLHRGASDLHLTTGRPPILRINGKLHPLPFQPLSESDMRLLLFSILSGRQRTIYQLEYEIDFALSLESGQRFRVNAYYQKGKMAAALRAIPSHIPDPEILHIPEQIMTTADHPHGLVLVVGPTGSGKSTTLACMIDRINKTRACRIITIEDPIEFTHTSQKSTIDQRELYADTKSFSGALKFILRQDPDVILIGEMRDIETISAALTAAETGHLVFATLHTNNAVQTIARIIDVFPAHQQPQVRSQLSASLLAVISQRLLLRKDQPGRLAAFEIMLANPAIRNLIREDKMHQAQSIMESSRSVGMVTLDYALQDLFFQELISYEAAIQYITNPQLLTAPKSNSRSRY